MTGEHQLDLASAAVQLEKDLCGRDLVDLLYPCGKDFPDPGDDLVQKVFFVRW